MAANEILINLASCRKCDYSVLPQGTTFEQWDAWKAGEKIQNAMPHLSVSDREVLISGYCGTCFDELFAPEPVAPETPNDLR